MLQEHDSPFEDIDFDSPQRSFSLPTHSLQIDTLYHHDSQNDDIQRARNRRSNTQEQQRELLEYIAAKEKIISDLEEQLHGHQMDLKLLKENWTRIVTQCSRPSTLESSLQSNQGTQGTQEKVYETQAIRNVNTQPIKKVNTQSINDVSMVGTNVTHKESPTSPYDGISQGLASAYQNLRDTLENVAPTESFSYQAMTALRSAMQRTYQVMSAPILEEDNQTDMDYFSAIPITGPSVFGRSPFFVPSPRSQGSPKSVAPALPPKLKKPQHVRSMTIG